MKRRDLADARRRVLAARDGADLRAALADVARLELDGMADDVVSWLADLPHSAQRAVLVRVCERLGHEQSAQLLAGKASP